MTKQTQDQLLNLSLSIVSPDPDQPRKDFDLEALKELTASVKAQGIIQPIIVRPNPKKEGHYLIVAGERRFRAAKKAGLKEVPAVVKSEIAESLRAVQLTENFYREDLTLLEIAEGIEKHIQDCGKKKVTNADLVKEFGRNATYWSRVRKVAKAPEVLKKEIEAKNITNINVISDLVSLHELDAGTFNDVWGDYLTDNIDGNLENYVACQVKMAKQIKEFGFVMPVANPSGVYEYCDAVISRKYQSDNIDAVINVLQIAKDEWALGTNIMFFGGYAGGGIVQEKELNLNSESMALIRGVRRAGNHLLSVLGSRNYSTESEINRYFGAESKKFVSWINEQLESLGDTTPRFGLPEKPVLPKTETAAQNASETTNNEPAYREEPTQSESLETVNTAANEALEKSLADESAVLQSELKAAITQPAEETAQGFMDLQVPVEIQPLLSRVVGYYIAVTGAMDQNIAYAELEKMVKQLTGEVRSNMH